MVDTSIIQDFHNFVKTNHADTDNYSVRPMDIELKFNLDTGKEDYAYFDFWVDIVNVSAETVINILVDAFTSYLQSENKKVLVDRGFPLDTWDFQGGGGIRVYMYFHKRVDVFIKAY